MKWVFDTVALSNFLLSEAIFILHLMFDDKASSKKFQASLDEEG